MTFPVRHISVSINRSPVHVYDFVFNPENLPLWAAGLSGSIQKEGDDWIADSPMGRVRVKFAEKNTFGVLDHVVTLPSGTDVFNPMRVFPNNDGSEVVFTVYQLPEVDEQRLLEDVRMVEHDLQTLKQILEA